MKQYVNCIILLMNCLLRPCRTGRSERKGRNMNSIWDNLWPIFVSVGIFWTEGFTPSSLAVFQNFSLQPSDFSLPPVIPAVSKQFKPKKRKRNGKPSSFPSFVVAPSGRRSQTMISLVTTQSNQCSGDRIVCKDLYRNNLQNNQRVSRSYYSK